MIRVTSQGTVVDADTNAVAYHYEIANKPVVFQTAVARLRAYEVGPASTRFSDLLNSTTSNEVLDASNAELKYRGRASFNLNYTTVSYWRNKDSAQINVNSEPVCRIDFATEHIHVLNNKSFDDSTNLAVITGPALILLLSQSDIYCLNAGAVATPHGCVAMLAEFGAGKSTLSAHVDKSWSQLADDILPLKFIDDVEIFHRFPQLKLGDATIVDRPKKPLFLKCILRLVQEPSEKTEFKALKRTDALFQVVSHTIGARLFDEKMMRKHAKFAKHVTAHIPTIEVSYPRDLSKLDSLRAEISEFIDML